MKCKLLTATILAFLATIAFADDKKDIKKEPITVSMPRDAFTVQPDGSLTYADGVKPDEVVIKLFMALEETKKALIECKTPAKKVEKKKEEKK